MSYKLAKKNLDKLFEEIDRAIVLDTYVQGIITVKKEDYREYLKDKVRKAGELEQLQFEFDDFDIDILDKWWAYFNSLIKKGETGAAKFQTDPIFNGDTTLIQYIALTSKAPKATQNAVADYVKRKLRKAARDQKVFIANTLLNAHAAGGGGERNFPDTDSFTQAEIDAQITEGQKYPRSPQHRQKSKDMMKKGGKGAKGTVANQRIDKILNDWAADMLKIKDGQIGTGKLMKLQMWWTKGWYNKFFGKEIGFEGNFKARGIHAGLLVQHTIRPNDHLNSGTLDAAIYDLFNDQLTVIPKVLKALLSVLPLNKMLNFWADSPAPIDKVSAIAKKVVIDNLFTHKTTPNMRLKVNKNLYKLAKDKSSTRNKSQKGGKGLNNLVAGGLGFKARKKKKVRATPSSGRGQGMTQPSPIVLRNLLNEALPQMVASKMTSPALRFRTGRFANSARVESLDVGPRGGIGIDYTYQRDPYETFEPGNKQGSTQRDPRKIIGASIRELATGILGRQPSTIRRI
jgi:hypothetical protein